MTQTPSQGQPSNGDESTVDGGAWLDNLTLARKEGRRSFVHAPARHQPEALTLQQIRALDDDARPAYDKQRRVWHANLGPLKTPQLAALHEDLWDIVDSNVQDGDKAKGAIAIDAFPGLGKTTAVLAFAKQFHLREIAERGEHTVDGHERWPPRARPCPASRNCVPTPVRDRGPARSRNAPVAAINESANS